MTSIARLSSAAICTISLVLSGCSSAPQPAEDQRLSWRELSGSGLGSEERLAVFLSTFPDADGPGGLVGLIDGNGETRFLSTEPHDGGLIASEDRVLCATDRLRTYRISTAGASRTSRGGYERSSGHWTGVSESGECIAVLNSGMGERHYDTDVYWEVDGALSHSVVPDIPGPTGTSPGAMWVRNGSLTKIPGRLTLYRTDLRTGATSQAMSWPTWRESQDGQRLNFDDGYATNLFWHEGRLVYLEDLLTVDKTGQRTEIKPGVYGELRLASIDPQARRHESTLLQYTSDGLLSPATEGDPVNPAAVAMRAGHLDGDTLYSANAAGQIVGVDLEAKSLRVVGELSSATTRATQAAAAWRGDRLYLVLVAADRSVSIETYDLSAGDRVDTQEVHGWGKVLEHEQLYLSSAAALG